MYTWIHRCAQTQTQIVSISHSTVELKETHCFLTLLDPGKAHTSKLLGRRTNLNHYSVCQDLGKAYKSKLHKITYPGTVGLFFLVADFCVPGQKKYKSNQHISIPPILILKEESSDSLKVLQLEKFEVPLCSLNRLG